MNDESKYIIVTNDHGFEQAIVFGYSLSHKQVAGGMNVVSAGFVRFPDEYNGFSCWGKSTTLGVDSRGEKDIEIMLSSFPTFRN